WRRRSPKACRDFRGVAPRHLLSYVSGVTRVPRTPPRPGGTQEADRVRRRFERLLAAGVAIFSERELGRVLQCITDSAREVVGARYAALGVLAPDGSSLCQFVTSGVDDALRKRIGDLPQGQGLLGLVIRERRAIRTADITRHPRRYGFPPHHPPMKSFLGVPIVSHDRVFGNLYLTEKVGADEFDEEDEAIAVHLAAQAAVAVENARLNDETKALLGQVQAMQRQRDLFFAMMNHELRNALTGVYGWAERLVRVKSPEAVAQAGREVFEAAERTITLLNNVLDLTRLDAGKVRPVWRDLDLGAELERALAGLRPAADAKGIPLEVERPDGVATLRSDPVRLEQILVNLLSNAIRHSPEGRPVTVRVEGNRDEVRFHVIDQGPGIPPEHLERLFEPFERFEPHSGVGTGLGLPVSRRLAELLGGRLTVESQVGRGSRFTLVLPMVPAEA
ncbi:MAG TPA: GAF domain-containing sensor histidine kinase, partial [Gemmatimonadales bacterium]|nr:GAF domain-containing sensor histidine kinase [Gemmatimonadales bacterium]